MSDGFDIPIRFPIDKSGTAQAASELQKLKEQVKGVADETKAYGTQINDAAKKTDFLNFKKSELKKLLGELKQLFPGFANVAKLALDPRLLGITLLIRSFSTLKEMISKTLEIMTPAEWTGRADAIKAGAAALEQAAIGANAYWHELDRAKSASAQLEESTQKQIAARREEQAAQNAVIEAKQKAGLIGPEQANQEKARAKEKADKEEINQLTLEQTSLAIRIGNLTKELPGMQTAAGQAAASNASLTKERDIYSGNIASSNAKIAQYEAEFEARKKGMRSGIFDSLSDSSLQAAYQSAIAARNSAQGALNKFNQNAVGVFSRNNSIISDAGAAQSELSSSRTRFDTLSGTIADKKRSFATNQQTTMLTAAIGQGAGDMGSLLVNAAAGADAIKAGGKATADQANAINQAAALLGLSGQNMQVILSLLGRMNDSQQSFQNSLKELERRVNTTNRKP